MSGSLAFETQGYTDAALHLTDELGYVRALLHRALVVQRGMRPRRNLLGGMAVDETEVDRFLTDAPSGDTAALDLRIVQERRAIDRRVATRACALPLIELGEHFGLDPIDRDIVIVLLAPEVEVAFERAYAATWDDFTRKRADVGFVAGLIGRDARERHQVALRLVPGATLERSGLVDLEPQGDKIAHGFLSRPLRLSPRVVAHLLGGRYADEVLAGAIDVVTATAIADDLVLEDHARTMLQTKLDHALAPAMPRVLLYGPRGGGKKLVASVGLAASRPGSQLACVNLSTLLDRGGDWLRAVRREALLHDAAIYLDATGIDPHAIGPSRAAAVASALADFPHAVFVATYEPTAVLGAAFAGASEITVPSLDHADRAVLWRRAIAGRASATDDVVRDAAHRFPLTAGAITAAADVAIDRARQRTVVGLPAMRRDDVIEGARGQLAPRLTGLATRITSTVGWDDVVLPDDVLARLRDLTNFAAQRRRVFDDWSFGTKFPGGRGLSALFYGAPGTGKTMVAGLIAAELGMELFRIDVSRMVSKWIGETEKNLSRVFDEAQAGQTILLFDEADSLFSKRTDVKSSNDRYANLEVNYLLQRMEDFDGVTILTTNLEQGIDEASKRRLRFRIEFPFPEAAERGELWRRMFPDEIRPAGIDWRALGARFELAGGNIKNAVLHAAFTAAHRNSKITPADLLRAAQLECSEMGRVVMTGKS
jgi:ATP-dependent 26S proteasome regulatory subunit